MKNTTEGKVIAVLVYIDEINVTGDDVEQQRLKQQAGREIEIRDLGKLKYFLGIDGAYSKEGIFLSQHKYVLDLLEEPIF